MSKYSKYILLISVLISFTTEICAQNHANIWYWNNGVGLKFKNSKIIPFRDLKISNTYEKGDFNISGYCDSMGKQVIYSNGVHAYDSANSKINNGNPFMSAQPWVHYNLLIKTKQPDQFLIFSTSSNSNDFTTSNQGLYYQRVSSNGQIIVSDSLLLANKYTANLCAYTHPSDEFTWLVYANYKNLYIYKVSGATITLHNSYNLNGRSYMNPDDLKFSNFGNFIGFQYTDSSIWDSSNQFVLQSLAKTRVLKFDKYKGEIVADTLLNNWSIWNSFEFSPNEKYIYNFDYLDSITTKLMQTTNPLLVTNSNGTPTEIVRGNRAARYLAQVPDGRVLIFNTNVTSEKFISSIEFPNNEGANCGYKAGILDIPYEWRIDLREMPKFVKDYISHSFITADTVCLGDSTLFRFYNNFTDSIQFTFNGQVNTLIGQDTFSIKSTKAGYNSVDILCYYPAFKDTITVSFYVDSIPLIDLGSDSLLCDSRPLEITLDTTNVDAFLWFDGSFDHTKTLTKSIFFWVNATNKYCFTSDTLKVEFAKCDLSTNSLCYGDSTVFTLAASNLDSAIFTFDDGNIETTTANKIKHLYLSDGEYHPSIQLFTNGLSREIKDTIEITRIEDNYLIDSITACEPTTLSPSLSQLDYDYIWSTGQATRELEIEKTGIYSLSIARNGCYEIDSCFVTIEDCECPVYIPNSFTPNGDNINEIFSLWTDCELLNVSMSIYSRWGELIVNASENWDGRYQGVLCPNGVYLWTISYKDRYNKTHYESGTVHLIR